MYKPIVILAALASLLLSAPLAVAADAGREIATAAVHAQMAAAASNKIAADMHMQHVINCLVGPSDKRFDAKAGDPCKGMGNGAIHDLGHAPTEHIRLQRVLMLAESGLHDKNLHNTRQAAKLVAEVLKQTGPR